MPGNGEDHLWEPAGPTRVVIGLVCMAGSVFLAAFAVSAAWKVFAGIVFIASPFIMLRRK